MEASSLTKEEVQNAEPKYLLSTITAAAIRDVVLDNDIFAELGVDSLFLTKLRKRMLLMCKCDPTYLNKTEC
jgi:hypothetical protein